MRIANKKTMALFTSLVSFALLSGCTNWEKKYQALSVEHENLKGLLIDGIDFVGGDILHQDNLSAHVDYIVLK